MDLPWITQPFRTTGGMQFDSDVQGEQYRDFYSPAKPGSRNWEVEGMTKAAAMVQAAFCYHSDIDFCFSLPPANGDLITFRHPAHIDSHQRYARLGQIDSFRSFYSNILDSL